MSVSPLFALTQFLVFAVLRRMGRERRLDRIGRAQVLPVRRRARPSSTPLVPRNWLKVYRRFFEKVE